MALTSRCCPLHSWPGLPLAFVPQALMQHPLYMALSWVRKWEGWAFWKQTETALSMGPTAARARCRVP